MASSPLDEAQVRAAVSALFKHLAKERAGKSALFDEEDMFSLVIALKKTPAEGKAKPYRLAIPHPLWTLAGSEVCLFVKDHEGEGTKAAKAVLSATATGVTKVLGYSKLKSNFKPHEAKRRLCASYDLFLADDRLLHLLPPLLGKSFFKKKKQPIPVDISGVSGASWAGAISRALSSTYLFLGGGACSAVRVARTQQGESEVVANVLSAAAGVAGCAGVKGGWGNVRAVYLKTNGSVALPLYTDLPLMAGAVEKEKKEAAAAAGAAPGTGKGKAAKSAPKAAKGAAEAVQAPPVAQPQPAAAGSKRKGGRALEAPPPGAAAAAAPAPAPARNKKPATAAPARKAAPAPAPAAAPAPAKRARRA